MKSIHWSGFLCLLLIATFVGCGESTSVISGQVHVGGSPVKLADGQVMKVVLELLEPVTQASQTADERASLIASVSKNGEFTFPVVQTGQYSVTVSDFDRFPSHDRLAEHFRQQPREVVWDIPSDQTAFVIELEEAWFQPSPKR
tara:strand:- start:462 stop:893 length:432 start_codon:yes stop_codon:yes gene_type:complete